MSHSATEQLIGRRRWRDILSTLERTTYTWVNFSPAPSPHWKCIVIGQLRGSGCMSLVSQYLLMRVRSCEYLKTLKHVFLRDQSELRPRRFNVFIRLLQLQCKNTENKLRRVVTNCHVTLSPTSGRNQDQKEPGPVTTVSLCFKFTRVFFCLTVKLNV